MKLLTFFLLATFGARSVHADCFDRAEGCAENLVASLVDDTTKEQLCRTMKNSMDCLESVINDCFYEREEDVSKELRELENLLAENCKEENGYDNFLNDDDDNDEIGQCFEENEEYIYECLYEGPQEALGMLLQKGEKDENVVKCTMYGMVASCFVERVGEKCGKTAGRMVFDEFSDLPEEIKDACDALEREEVDPTLHTTSLSTGEGNEWDP